MFRYTLATFTLIASAALAAGQPAADVSPAPPPSTAPATAPMDEAQWNKTLTALGDANFATREAAQRQLDQTTWRDLARLRVAVKYAADAEVKTRLASRIAAIETDIAVNPPPISLDLDHASFPIMVSTLSEALGGVPLEPWPPNGSGVAGANYTLHAHEKPFWDVVRDLTDQRTFRMNMFGDKTQLMVDSGMSLRRAQVFGPVIIVPESITRYQTVDLHAAPGGELQPAQTLIQAMLMVDPRLRMSGSPSVMFTDITDDAGNVLWKNAMGARNRMLGQVQLTMSFATALNMPPKPGKRIASAKGEAVYTVVLDQETVELEQADTKQGQTVAIGGTQVRIAKIDVSGTHSMMMLERPSPNATLMAIGRAVANLPDDTVKIEAIDAKGKVFQTTYISTGTTSSSTGTGEPIQTPIKLRFSKTTKTKDVTVPFEFKDLPLPGN